MIIQKIEIENFRQFYGKHEIKFKNKVNIIYGENGTGKTTLHQFFSWVIFNKFHFNYNGDFSENQIINSKYLDECQNGQIAVSGRIFYFDENIEKDFKIERKFIFKVSSDDKTKKVEIKDRSFKMIYKNNNDDWVTANDTAYYINQQIPEPLSHYFFFDGERMVSEFVSKDNIEAEKLKNTMYDMFDISKLIETLYCIDGQEIHERQSAIYKLNKRSSNDKATLISYNQLDTALKKQENYEKIKNDLENNISKNQKERDEKIMILGSFPNIKEINNDIKKKEGDYKKVVENIKNQKLSFGEFLLSKYAEKTLARLYVNNQRDINDEKTNLENEMPAGINLNLLNYISKSNRCICGKPLNESDKELFYKWNESLKNNSNYEDQYLNRLSNAKTLIENEENTYDDLNSKYNSIIDIIEVANNINTDIANNKKRIKLASDAEQIKIFNKAEELKSIIEKDNIELRNVKNDLEKAKREVNNLREKYKNSLNKDEKWLSTKPLIDCLYKIADKVKTLLDNQLEKCKKELSNNISDLTSKIFNGNRNAYIDDNFILHVPDNYKNESLSEGQFAVCTFAYIGGILKTLNDNMIKKAYPLILDGPFSKLDEIHKKNVTKCLITFSSQIIIFSKDDLNDYIDKDSLGNVYVINSNKDKNISRIEEKEV